MRSHGFVSALERRTRGGFVLPGWMAIAWCSLSAHAASSGVTSAESAPVIASCPRDFDVTADKDITRAAVASDADGVVADVRLSTPTPLIVLGKRSPVGGVGASFTAEVIAKAALPSGVFTVTFTFSNLDTPAQSASCSVTVTKDTPTRAVRIREIQGRSHLSPLVGQRVDFPGIVTVRTASGFYLQDRVPDGDDATSEGIFVFTDSTPAVTVGDGVRVTGIVSERRAAGSPANLTVTSIIEPSIVVESSGNALPPPTLIGEGGRALLSTIIDNDARDDVETSGKFEADVDGIDFYESLEGMRVQVNDILAVGPTTSTGEIAVLPNNQSGSQPRSERGGVIVTDEHFVPQRVILDDALEPLPQVNVRDRAVLAAGVLDYSAGNFKLLVTSTPRFVSTDLAPEITDPAGPEQLTVATMNAENLSAADSLAKVDALAAQILTHLRAPDVLALIDVQDDNGAVDDDLVTASQSFLQLIDRIVAAGGARYAFRQIDPVDDQDGGAPGGNVRVGLLFNASRVSFVDRAGGTANNGISVVAGPQGPQLSASPGRIDPRHPAFNASRKPLAAEFVFNGQTVFVIVNDFVSKDADTPLFGRFQPPRLNSAPQRLAQASVLVDFVNSIRVLDRRAKIVVLGGFNDFPFAPSLRLLQDTAGLFDPSGTPTPYNVVLDGNSQALDHILLSSALLPRAEYDSVHVNSEFAAQVGDHDPLLVRLPLPPVVDLAGNFEIQRSGLIFNRGTRLFVGTVTLTNKSTAAIAGPLEIAFESLPVGVQLVNATGFRNVSPSDSGDPTIALPGNYFAPGASVQITLQFFNPSNNFVFVDYTLRVFKVRL